MGGLEQWAGALGGLAGVAIVGVLLWLETRKRKDAEFSRDVAKVQIEHTQGVNDDLRRLLRKRNAETKELRSKLSVRDRHDRLFGKHQPETD